MGIHIQIDDNESGGYKKKFKKKKYTRGKYKKKRKDSSMGMGKMMRAITGQ